MERKKHSESIDKKGAKMKTHGLESQLTKFETSQAELEERYQCPLKRVEDIPSLVRPVSEMLGKDGEHELKLLILENRVPIIVGDDRQWYTEWYPEGAAYWSLVDELLHNAVGRHSDLKQWMHEDSRPEDLLRLSVGTAVHREINRLKQLALQLSNEGESSAVLDRQIDCLEELNTDLPSCPDEFSEILN